MDCSTACACAYKGATRGAGRGAGGEPEDPDGPGIRMAHSDRYLFLSSHNSVVPDAILAFERARTTAIFFLHAQGRLITYFLRANVYKLQPRLRE